MKKREAELRKPRSLACWRPPRRRIPEEDETFGQNKRGDEMPDWAGDKQKRLAKIQQAMTALEADARSWRRRKSVASRRKKEQQRQKPKAARSRANRRRRHRTSLIPSRNRNFTDPESRIMKSKDGFVQAYNAQAAVDAGAQIISTRTN